MQYAILAVFLVSYAGITSRRLRWVPMGRPAMALVGATTCVALGEAVGPPLLGLEDGLRAIELHTLTLLLGMMLVSAGLGEGGFFAWVTGALARRVTDRVALLWAVTLGSGLLSALLVNDAVCLLATPLVVQAARKAKAAVRPFLFAVAMGSNAGSALTLAGNPQNMLVAKLSGLTYRGYLGDVALPVLGALVVTAVVLHLLFRTELHQGAVGEEGAVDGTLDRPLVTVALLALTGAVIANVAGAALALTAAIAATLTLLGARLRADRLLQLVDWGVLLFFGALFVLVAALQRTGLPALALGEVDLLLGRGLLGLTAVLSVGSQLVSNVPLIVLLEPWIRSFPDPRLAWTVTALVSTLAGNLTLLGSVANIIVLERSGMKMGFLEYLKVGVVVTSASTAVALGLLWLTW